jgi:hypothetical protein
MPNEFRFKINFFGGLTCPLSHYPEDLGYV